MRGLHRIFTTYIHMMPVKITELRNHGDEVAREEMLRTLRGAPSTSHLTQNFGEFMLLLGNLYSNDPHNLDLSLDYWPNTEQPNNQAYQHKTVTHLSFLYFSLPLFSLSLSLFPITCSISLLACQQDSIVYEHFYMYMLYLHACNIIAYMCP